MLGSSINSCGGNLCSLTPNFHSEFQAEALRLLLGEAVLPEYFTHIDQPHNFQLWHTFITRIRCAGSIYKVGRCSVASLTRR
jgi:hypothetical protein